MEKRKIRIPLFKNNRKTEDWHAEYQLNYRYNTDGKNRYLYCGVGYAKKDKNGNVYLLLNLDLDELEKAYETGQRYGYEAMKKKELEKQMEKQEVIIDPDDLPF